MVEKRNERGSTNKKRKGALEMTERDSSKTPKVKLKTTHSQGGQHS